MATSRTSYPKRSTPLRPAAVGVKRNVPTVRIGKAAMPKVSNGKHSCDYGKR